MRVSTLLTTNPGASWTSTARLPSRDVASHAVASVRVVGRGRADQLDERQHGDGVEEVHADDAARGGRARRPSRTRRATTCSSRGRRRRDTTCSSSREDLLLDAELLEHRLEHEVAAGEASRSRFRPRRSTRGSGLRSGRRPFATRPFSSPPIQATASSTCSCVEIDEHDRHLEAAHEQQRELRRHQPCADDADPPDRARLGVGPTDALLRSGARRRRTHRRDACACGPGSSSASASSSARYPSSSVHAAAPSISSSARYGAGAAPCTWSSTRARAAADLGGVGEIGGSRLVRARLDRADRNASDSSRNSTGSSNGRRARPRTPAARSSMRFWRSGLATTSPTAARRRPGAGSAVCRPSRG